MAKNKDQNTEKSGIRRETLLWIAVGAAVCILLGTVLAGLTSLGYLRSALVALVVFLLEAVGVYVLLEVRHKHKNETLEPVMGRIMFEAIVKMHAPVFICDSQQKIVWYNSCAEEITGNGKLYGASLPNVFGLSLQEIRSSNENGGAHFSVGGRSFVTQYHHIKTDDEDFSLIVSTETTEFDALTEKVNEEELAVCYIVSDNLDEMLQYDSEQYRPASAKADEIIREWAAEYGAILKEYERDKYLLITQSRMLDKMVASKFDILDRVREVKAGETKLPLTVSIGVSSVKGTFEEKEKAAHAALDMALQRGGDQAAVKGDESMEFYGGVTKSVQKRTNVRARVVASELVTGMCKASNVLIMGHNHGDFDSFGASVGLARLALFSGAKVHIVINKADRNLLGCREVMAENEEYRNMFVSAEEALDQLESGTFVIVTDVCNLALVEAPDVAKRAQQLAVIDHHRKMSEFEREPDVEYIEPSASSACELVAEMLDQILPKDELSPSEAYVMLAGITLDTKQFTKNTGTRTFSAAMYLRDRGADPTMVQELFRESFDDYRGEAVFRNHVELYRSVYAITVVDHEETGDSVDRVLAAKAADHLLKVDGVKASFAVLVDGVNVHISARSVGDVNVQLIMESMGGGGHFDGAAVQINANSAEEAIEVLKTAIDDYTDQKDSNKA